MAVEEPVRRRSPFTVGFTAGAGLLCAVTLFLALRATLSVLLLVVGALFVAIGLHPAVAWLHGRGMRRGLAVALVALACLLVGCSGLVALAPPLVNETSQLAESLPAYLDKIAADPRVSDFADRFDVVERLKAAATADNISAAMTGALGGIQVFFGVLFNVLTVAVLTIYFLAAWPRLKEGCYRMFPATRRHQARQIGDEIFDKIGGYLLGSLAVALLAGLTAFVFLLIVSVPYAFALAMVVGLCDLIPQIGAMLGAIVVAVAGFAQSVPVGIACVVFFVAYQQLENWIVAPRVMRRSVDISDLAVILSALFGAVLLGAIGALIAIPVCASVQLIIRKLVLPRLDRT